MPIPTTRSLHIHFIALLLSVLLLSGCGFHLKQTAALPASYGPVSIEGVDQYSDLYKFIKSGLRQSDISLADADAAASSRLQASLIKNERRVLSVGSSGKVAEYELIQTLRFQLLAADGSAITEPQTFTSNRSYNVSSTDVLGNDLEEAEIRTNMQKDLVERMFRYLANTLH